MAKMAEQLAVIRVSKAVKNSEDDNLNVLTSEIGEQLQEVLEALLGEGLIVEVEVGE